MREIHYSSIKLSRYRERDDERETKRESEGDRERRGLKTYYIYFAKTLI